MKLIVCSNCRRHVASRDTLCPFCNTQLRTGTGLAVKAGLAAALLVGVGLTAACSGSDTEPGTGGSGGSAAQDAAPDTANLAYGPPPDAEGDAKVDAPVAAYGPPPEAGVDAEPDAPVTAYGPPPDSGAGGVYGPPPLP